MAVISQCSMLQTGSSIGLFAIRAGIINKSHWSIARMLVLADCKVRIMVALVAWSVGVLLTSTVSAQSERSVSNPIVAEDSELVAVTEDCRFTEGPTANSKGEVYFTDQLNNRILKIDLDGDVTEFLKPAGRSNGMFFDSEDRLVACADERNQMWEINVDDGSHRVLFESYDGKVLNGPNDLWIHPGGWIYFTDPFYKRSWWEHDQMQQEGQSIYRVRRNGTKIERLDFKFTQPNGIIGDPLTNVLYVSDIKAKKTYRFDIDEDGGLSNQALFCEEGSDGMTIDINGHVYLTNEKGVVVFDTEGQQVANIAMPQPWTANVCFGGVGHSTLFITATKGVYSIQTKQKGLRARD